MLESRRILTALLLAVLAAHLGLPAVPACDRLACDGLTPADASGETETSADDNEDSATLHETHAGTRARDRAPAGGPIASDGAGFAAPPFRPPIAA